MSYDTQNITRKHNYGIWVIVLYMYMFIYLVVEGESVIDFSSFLKLSFLNINALPLRHFPLHNTILQFKIPQ